MRTVVEGYVRGFLDHLEATRVLVSFWGRIGRDQRAREANAELYAGYRRGAAHLLESADLAPIDVAGMSTVMVGVVLGIAMQAYFQPTEVDVNAAVNVAVETVLARLRISR